MDRGLDYLSRGDCHRGIVMSLQLVTVLLLVAAAALFIGRSVRRALRGDAAGDGCHDCGKPQQPRGLGYRRSRTDANEQKPVDPR